MKRSGPERRVRWATACVLVVGTLAAPGTAGAWGLSAHRWVALRAADLVAAACPALVRGTRDALATHAVEPDTILKQRQRGREAPRHFLNLDHYGPPPFARLPRDYQEALRRYGAPTLRREGVLPWNGGELARRLRAELRKGDLAAARVTAGYLAHYAADATMPLHATTNHDGQETGQRGLHRRVESVLVDDDLAAFTRRAESVPARTPIAPKGVEGALFAALEDGHRLVATVLAADRAARRGTRAGSRVYYRRLRVDLEAPLARQLGAAAVLTAAIWEGACAGTPAAAR